MPIPLDDGLLRRECPHCERQFKWHNGPTDERADDAAERDVYYCPYCGEPAPLDAWWTKEQLEHAAATIAGPVANEVSEELRRAFGSRRGSKIEVSVDNDASRPPPPLHEPPDMITVQPPCHPWEPLKVLDDSGAPLHCLACGEQFALG